MNRQGKATNVTLPGTEIPVLGLGVWELSGSACEAAVENALRLGYRHVDTAAMYGNEAEVGRAVRRSGCSDVFITTKIWRDDLAPRSIERSVKSSREKLGMAALDLLLVHWPNAEIPLRRTVETLCALQHQGVAKRIGVANFPSTLLREACAVARANGSSIAANQCEYHPWLSQKAVLAVCSELGVAFISYSPLGKMINGAETLTLIAERHGRSVAQIILRWHVQQGVAAIPKAGSSAHAAENLAVFDFELSDAEMTSIFELSSTPRRLVTPAFSPAWDPV